MRTNLRFLFAIVMIVAMFSSCKKAAVTDVSMLTSHKWNLTSYNETYSDSTVTHNLIPVNTTCTSTGYMEFRDYATNSSLRLAYAYNTSQCPGYFMPNIGVSSWNIDPDNTVLYLNGSSTDGTGGSWYTIKTLTGSSIVLTTVSQQVIGYTGTYPNQTPIYHTVTDTWTYSAQ